MKGATMYAVCVTFKLKSGQSDAFMPLMRANARTSLQHEDGCHQFDVLSDPAKPDQVFLYELYSNRAAFDAHLNSTHFKTFDAASAEMIADKDVQTWGEVTQ
jgi:quinol monooxygenase YgiN